MQPGVTSIATTKIIPTALSETTIVTAQNIIDNRDKLLMVSGLWSGLYAVAKAVRDKGYSAKDFNPDNCIYVGGGLKRAQLPADYKEFVHETFNIPHNRGFVDPSNRNPYFSIYGNSLVYF